MTEEFGGKEYFFHTIKSRKADAKSIANKLRNKGFLVRVQPTKEGYMIWTRENKKYWCGYCDKYHIKKSKIGKKHLEYDY